ncbi:hypothetical protein GQR58_030033 [Nymphon striatum]|nr:hypothetical protein GQR58_030033 [Nymphon striatum]
MLAEATAFVDGHIDAAVVVVGGFGAVAVVALACHVLRIEIAHLVGEVVVAGDGVVTVGPRRVDLLVELAQRVPDPDGTGEGEVWAGRKVVSVQALGGDRIAVGIHVGDRDVDLVVGVVGNAVPVAAITPVGSRCRVVGHVAGAVWRVAAGGQDPAVKVAGDDVGEGDVAIQCGLALGAAVVDDRDVPLVVHAVLGDTGTGVLALGGLVVDHAVERLAGVVALGDIEHWCCRDEHLFGVQRGAVVKHLGAVVAAVHACCEGERRVVLRCSVGADVGGDDAGAVVLATEVAGHRDHAGCRIHIDGRNGVRRDGLFEHNIVERVHVAVGDVVGRDGVANGGDVVGAHHVVVGIAVVAGDLGWAVAGGVERSGSGFDHWVAARCDEVAQREFGQAAHAAGNREVVAVVEGEVVAGGEGYHQSGEDHGGGKNRAQRAPAAVAELRELRERQGLLRLMRSVLGSQEGQRSDGVGTVNLSHPHRVEAQLLGQLDGLQREIDRCLIPDVDTKTQFHVIVIPRRRSRPWARRSWRRATRRRRPGIPPGRRPPSPQAGSHWPLAALLVRQVSISAWSTSATSARLMRSRVFSGIPMASQNAKLASVRAPQDAIDVRPSVLLTRTDSRSRAVPSPCRRKPGRTRMRRSVMCWLPPVRSNTREANPTTVPSGWVASNRRLRVTSVPGFRLDRASSAEAGGSLGENSCSQAVKNRAAWSSSASVMSPACTSWMFPAGSIHQAQHGSRQRHSDIFVSSMVTAMTTSGDEQTEAIKGWLAAKFGGPVTSIERQARWRPVWFATVTTSDGPKDVVVRGDRTDMELIFPLDHEMRFQDVMHQHGLPVPEVHGWIDEPAAYVMETVPGEPYLAGGHRAATDPGDGPVHGGAGPVACAAHSTLRRRRHRAGGFACRIWTDACEVGGVGAGQEHGHPADVGFRVAEAFHGDGRDHPLVRLGLVTLVVLKRRTVGERQHRIGADAVVGPLPCGRPGHDPNGLLHPGVHPAVDGVGLHSRAAAQIDDDSAAGEVRVAQSHEPQRGQRARFPAGVGVVVCDGKQRPVRHLLGVVHQNVHGAVSGHGLGDATLDVGQLLHVALVGNGNPASSFDLGNHRVALRNRAARHHYLGAFVGHGQCDASAHTLPATGHDGHLVLESSHH